MFLIFLKRRRGVTAERLRTAKFFSTEKGFFNHWVDREHAVTELTRLLEAMTKEIVKATAVHHETSRKARAAAARAPDPKRAQRIADNAAIKLNKRTGNLEKYHADFAKAADTLIESDAAMVAVMTNEAQLRESLQSYSSLQVIMHEYGEVANVARDSQMGLRGYSQELNTAINRITNFLDEHIASVALVEEHCRRSVVTVTRLLG